MGKVKSKRVLISLDLVLMQSCKATLERFSLKAVPRTKRRVSTANISRILEFHLQTQKHELVEPTEHKINKKTRVTVKTENSSLDFS